jgi:hypothetical protein
MPNRHRLLVQMRSLLTELEALGAPQSPEEHAVLVELAERAHELLGTDAPTRGERVEPVRKPDKRTWVEINCMLCAEWAGVLIEGKELHPRYEGSLRQVGGRVVCGRCGGALAHGERGERYATP